jgi:hypothetical protein
VLVLLLLLLIVVVGCCCHFFAALLQLKDVKVEVIQEYLYDNYLSKVETSYTTCIR